MRKKFSFHAKGANFTLGERTWIMGILNITPDSFSDGGLYFDKARASAQGLMLIEEGADILDIGGESSRPGSNPISAEEEIRRVIPVIAAIREKTDVLISIDTTKMEVARAALEAGADIINDISAFRFEPEMLTLAKEKEAPVIFMHMLGMPKTMQAAPFYKDVLNEVRAFLKDRVDTAKSMGIKKEKIIIDPGIGFGKRLEDNFRIIKDLKFLEDIDQPILIGVSRKSFIDNILNLPPSERLEGTIAASILSILNGAHILRVHDVAGVKKAVMVAEAIMSEISNPPGTDCIERNQNSYAQ